MKNPSPLEQFEGVLKSRVSAAEKAARVIELAPVLPDAAIGVMTDYLPKVPQLVQVAIMDAYFEMTGDAFHEEDLIDILDRAARRKDRGEELYMAAREALGRVQGEPMDAWRDLSFEMIGVRQVRKRGIGRPRVEFEAVTLPSEKLTVIIHGTWAADGKWWRKGGNFYRYVKKKLNRDDLYDGDQPFQWSGRNDDEERREAAVSLTDWLGKHPAAEVNVFAHSHGANVAMLATHEGSSFRRLVMLSPPVRKDYFADWDRVGSAFNIQARFDPVVAIARGGRWFDNHGVDRVEEWELHACGHSASHDPKVWRDEQLASCIGIPWT